MLYPISFVRKGIFLAYKKEKEDSMPRIPWILDVLYIMDLGESQQFCSLGNNNAPTYIANLELVVKAVSGSIESLSPYDKKAAKSIIAHAIIELCPIGARCLLEPDFVRVLQIVGDKRYSAELLQSANQDALRNACTCYSCRSKK